MYLTNFLIPQTYLLKLSDKLYSKFGMPRIDHSLQEGLFSLRIQKWACSLQQTECVSDLLHYFRAFQVKKDIRLVHFI